MQTSTAQTSFARRLAAGLALLCAVLVAAPPCARAQGTAAAAQGARERKTAAPRGSITGRVVGEGGEPLANVSVYVRPRGVGLIVGRLPDLNTDEEGNFVAQNLLPGVYHVSARVPGYVPDPEQAGAAGDLGHRVGDFVTVRMIRGGVITGTVTDASGGPLPALAVRVFRVRERDGRPSYAMSSFIGEDQTDDRGVYRVYGLPAGGYVVSASGISYGWGALSPYAGNVATFYPSGTRDTAAEVAVRPGQETAGIDIRYRDERGRRVTGTFVLPAQADDNDTGVNISLNYAGTGMAAAFTWVNGGAADAAFSFEGIADGDYELLAHFTTRAGVSGSSPEQRVSVRGADVTGLRVTLAPLGSASGTLSVEPAPEPMRALEACKGRNPTAPPQETLILARRDGRAGPAAVTGARTRGLRGREATPDEAGAFTLSHLEVGAYRLEVRPLDENFYVSAVELRPAARPGPAAQGGRAPSAGADLLRVGSGEQIKGLSVRLAAGAAAAGGRVVAAGAGASPPPFGSLRVYLVPAERERADETLRYAQATPSADGSFAFTNLAPGRYLLVVRPAAEAADGPPRPAFWDADARARLRREAEAANLPLDLQPCQRLNDISATSKN